ncbi:MAG: glycosyltransferase, partial [Myxococcales bacterium]|nr:glycosyltransferase [Myxococcales bacterium]
KGWSGEAGPSCLSCDAPCDRAQPAVDVGEGKAGRRSWLVDAVWPEYAGYLRSHGDREDRLLLPLDGELLGRERYAWPRAAVGELRQLPARALIRSLRSRRLASQTAARQRALLAEDEALAAAMAALLEPEDTELVVAQNRLVHLWRRGRLGGRRVTVLMQRLPLRELQARLDRAAAANPHSPTLADFRADRALLEDEARAFAEVVRVVTPHAEVAACFPARALLLPWSRPSEHRQVGGPRGEGPLRLWLPASTVGRKGVWELRAALRALAVPVELWISGAELEGPGFWQGRGLVIRRGPPGALARLDAVVAPAWVEHQPRALLRASALGVPVIASRACGLAGLPGVVEVETGSVEALQAALTALLGGIRTKDPAGSRRNLGR